MGKDCEDNVTPNSNTETGQIYDAIQAVAARSKLDHRFILAVVMQESNGCVRVPTSYSPVPDNITNPGLMQCFEGNGTCNVKGKTPQNPCPTQIIWNMVQEGSMGTLRGDGLVQDMNEAGYTGAQSFYRAARLYNSGSIPQDHDLGGPGATRCYATDIANRLTGWVLAASKCTLTN